MKKHILLSLALSALCFGLISCSGTSDSSLEELDTTTFIACNESSFEKDYEGFFVEFDEPVDLTDKTSLTLDAVFLDDANHVVSANWGYGMYKLLSCNDWEDSSVLATQYNIGMTGNDVMSLSGLDGQYATGILIQVQKVDLVKKIGVRAYTFK